MDTHNMTTSAAPRGADDKPLATWASDDGRHPALRMAVALGHLILADCDLGEGVRVRLEPPDPQAWRGDPAEYHSARGLIRFDPAATDDELARAVCDAVRRDALRRARLGRDASGPTVGDLIDVAAGREPDSPAWREFCASPLGQSMSEDERRALASMLWPHGRPDAEHYGMALAALRVCVERSGRDS